MIFDSSGEYPSETNDFRQHNAEYGPRKVYKMKPT